MFIEYKRLLSLVLIKQIVHKLMNIHKTILHIFISEKYLFISTMKAISRNSTVTQTTSIRFHTPQYSANCRKGFIIWVLQCKMQNWFYNVLHQRVLLTPKLSLLMTVCYITEINCTV